jgi:hypothetical protein
MKGLELPINVLVVVAVAVLVLLGVIALFLGAFGGGGGAISLASSKSQACGQLQNMGCTTTSPTSIYPVNYDVNGDGNLTSEDNLQALCDGPYGGLNIWSSDSDSDTANRTLHCKVTICGCTGLPQPIRP